MNKRNFEYIIQRQQGLKKQLTSKQMTMIAIGGAIGTGLFLGSVYAIQLAGPAVLISYFIGGLIALMLMGCLAEMTSEHPTSGSFGDYAEFYINPLFGFLIRYAYWSSIVLAVGTEVTAIGIYMQYWFPESPIWFWVMIFSIVILSVNLVSVSSFGLVEYWLSTTKIIAIVGFIIIATAILIYSNDPLIGFSNYVVHGGFVPNGWLGVWFAVIVSIFSYLSIEMIAVAAGEAKDPVTAVKKAFKGTIVRLFLFYMLAIGLMLTIVPWQQTENTTSPFLLAMNLIQLPAANGIFNFIILIAALSAMNSQIYISTRMLFSLARAHHAPQFLGKINKYGIPLNSLFISCIGIGISMLFSIIAPEKAFYSMMSIAVFGACFTWFCIFVTHFFFRRQHRNTVLKFRMFGYPYTTLIGATLMFAITISTIFIDIFRPTLLFGIPFMLFLILFYYYAYHKKQQNLLRSESQAAS